jgi:SNF2 family DNA or RNA helicase
MKAGFQNAKNRHKAFDPENPDAHFVVPAQFRPDIMIGSLEILHKGLNLTQAKRLIIFSPDTNFSKIRQAIKRENRIGQLNPETIIYIISNKDSKIDVAIIKFSGHIQQLMDSLLSQLKAGEMAEEVVEVSD